MIRPILLSMICTWIFACSPFANSVSSQTVKAAPESGKYQLLYKLKPGQVIQSEVTHVAKTNTKVDKTEQASQSRSVSQKLWEVTGVDADGNMTFVHKISQVDMSQQVGDAKEIRYNSQSDPEAPSIYASVAKSIGKPISTVTIDVRGKVVRRDEDKNMPSLGMGDIALVMPEHPIAIGDSWDVPREIRVRDTEGGSKAIKLRELCTLEKVSAGVASISIRSEPLTPIPDPEVEAQVVQQLSNGTIRFDIDAGRMISKELKWDETVVGFSGSGSMMEYSARFNEEVKNVSEDPSIVRTAANPIDTANPRKPGNTVGASKDSTKTKGTPATAGNAQSPTKKSAPTARTAKNKK